MLAQKVTSVKPHYSDRTTEYCFYCQICGKKDSIRINDRDAFLMLRNESKLAFVQRLIMKKHKTCCQLLTLSYTLYNDYKYVE